jgi:hypothetical protein
MDCSLQHGGGTRKAMCFFYQHRHCRKQINLGRTNPDTGNASGHSCYFPVLLAAEANWGLHFLNQSKQSIQNNAMERRNLNAEIVVLLLYIRHSWMDQIRSDQIRSDQIMEWVYRYGMIWIRLPFCKQAS